MNAAIDTIARQEFIKARQKYLGGSDIAAMLGIAPPTWKRNSPLALYLDKVEPPSEDTQGKRFKSRGHRWEGVVGEMLVESLEERGHKVEIVSTNKRYIDPDVPYFACEIDFEIRLDSEEEITNVELKTVHPYKVAEWGEEGTDEAPVWYTAQAAWGMGITRRRRCLVAPLFGADEIRTYVVPAADEVITGIREAAGKFWNEHVLPRVPPPPGGLVDLARLFPKDIGTSIEVADNIEFVDALAELHAADNDYKLAEGRWNAAEEIIKGIMGENATATIGGKKACTWKTQGQTRVDVTRLREERPQTAAEFESRIEFRKFLLTRSKAK